MTRVLIAGLPRSGTTWLARALSSPEGVVACEEPDNHWKVAFAFRAKRSLPGRFHPILEPGDSADRYLDLWRVAFGLAPGPVESHRKLRDRTSTFAFRMFDRGQDRERSRARFLLNMHPGPVAWNLAIAEALAVPRRPDLGDDIVAKSVYATFSIEWIAAALPISVLVVQRDAHAVIASWKERGWLGSTEDDMLDEIDAPSVERVRRLLDMPPPPARGSLVARAAYFYALCQRYTTAAAKRHPEWRLVSYEALTANPETTMARLAASLGLPWTAASEASVVAMTKAGSGFDPSRSRDQIQASQDRLDPAEAAEIRSVLEDAGLAST